MMVLQFAHTFFPIPGGTSTRLFNLFENKEDIIHYLYVPYPKNRNLNYIDDKSYERIKIRRCIITKTAFGRIPILSPLLRLRLNAKTFINSVKEKNFDIVHGHNPLLFGYTAMRYSIENNIPFIFESHIFNLDSPINKPHTFLQLLKNIQYRIFRLIMKKIYLKATAIIVQTESIKKRLLNILPLKNEDVYVIPMGIDMNLFNPENWISMGKKLRDDKKWGSKIILMYNGYLSSYNGINLLLDAINSLPISIKKKIKLIILGRGPLQDYVEKFITKNRELFEFLGLVDYKTMPIYYSASDIIVIPRLSTHVRDNVPTKLLEAMAMKKILLGSNINSIKKLIKNGENGFLFKSGDKNDLIGQLIKIINNFDKFKKIQNNAKMCVMDRFNWRRMRNKLEKIYKNIQIKKS